MGLSRGAHSPEREKEHLEIIRLQSGLAVTVTITAREGDMKCGGFQKMVFIYQYSTCVRSRLNRLMVSASMTFCFMQKI